MFQRACQQSPPSDRVREPNPEAREAGRKLVAEGKKEGQHRRTFIHVNNRLERNALETIAEIVDS